MTAGAFVVEKKDDPETYRPSTAYAAIILILIQFLNLVLRRLFAIAAKQRKRTETESKMN